MAVNATTLNVPPNANAGHDQKVLTGQPVLLDGSKANDPDNGPGPLTYLWSFMSVPAGSLLTDANITNRETPLSGFTPDIDGEYKLDLSANDGAVTSHDQVSVTAGTTTPPVANAGIDQIVQLGQSVILDGSGSYDQDGLPQPITYQWSLVSVPTGSGITNSDIINSNTISAGFTPDIAGSYVLRLAVSDGLYTAIDNVVIEVDGVSPNGSIIINNGAVWTNTAAVTLALECTDSESGCMDMRLSNDNINFTDWEPFTTNKSWTLSSVDGEKRVYVQYRDGAGNWSERFSDSINLDTTKPVVKGVSDSPDPFRHHLGEKSTISFTLLDNLSGTCTVQVKIYNSANKLVRTIKKNGVSCPAGGAAVSVKWDGRNTNGVLVPAGTYTYKIQARDNATNKSATKQGTVGVE